jgi:hypothetical protein
MRFFYLLFLLLLADETFSQDILLRNKSEFVDGPVKCIVDTILLKKFVPDTSVQIRFNCRAFTQPVKDSGTVIKLRCGTVKALATNAPLFVVDGVIMNDQTLKGLDPNDIESITILKNANTTDGHISCGTKGVVLIKTRKNKNCNAINSNLIL